MTKLVMTSCAQSVMSAGALFRSTDRQRDKQINIYTGGQTGKQIDRYGRADKQTRP